MEEVTYEQPETEIGGGSYANCSTMKGGEIRQLALVRGVTGAVCFAACVLTLLLVVCKRGVAGMRDSTQTRLMSYLLLSAAVYLMVLSMHMEHYWNYRGGKHNEARQHWKVHLCKAIGLADQYTGSVQLFFVIGVSIHFFYHSLVFLRVSCPRYVCFSDGLSGKQKKCLETLLVIGSLVLPAMYIWVPFIAVEYGETGPWCWIKSLDKNCSELRGSGWEQNAMWYIPFGLTASFALLAIIFFLLSVKTNFKRFKRHKGQKTGEAVVLIVFLSTYISMFVVEISSHLIVTLHSYDSFAVWMLYAVSTPLGVVSLPIGLLVYTFTGTLREAAKQFVTCNRLRKSPIFVNMFRNTSSFTHVPHRPLSDSESC